MKKIILPIIVALAIPSVACAITVTGDATVVILNALTATQTQSMNFGRVLPGSVAGVVTLSPAGATTATGASAHGTANAGGFTITAQASTPLIITFGNGTVTNGSNSMTIDTFTSTSTPANNTTDASGNLTLKVGANLNVGANQAAGTYNGTYTVTVSY